MGNSARAWVNDMKDRLLDLMDLNVITVDWSLAARDPLYLKAAMNVPSVGWLLAQFIMVLVKEIGLSPGEMYIIGFSLGAHVAGTAGSALKEMGHILGRISGLDPAGPGFDYISAAQTLNSSDATFVDIIHTDRVAFGTAFALGNVYFFPNGEKSQAGCDFAGMPLTKKSPCDHNRAWAFYTESITTESCTFYAVPTSGNVDCNCVNGGCARLGFFADQPIVTDFQDPNGEYYVATRSSAPYCKT